jgi:hypothetical protein
MTDRDASRPTKASIISSFDEELETYPICRLLDVFCLRGGSPATLQDVKVGTQLEMKSGEMPVEEFRYLMTKHGVDKSLAEAIYEVILSMFGKVSASDVASFVETVSSTLDGEPMSPSLTQMPKELLICCNDLIDELKNTINADLIKNFSTRITVSSAARYLSCAAWLQSIVADDSVMGTYSYTPEATLYRHLCMDVPEVLSMALVCDDDTLHAFAVTLKNWVLFAENKKQHRKDHDMYEAIVDQDRGPVLYWLINSATSVQRATFVKLLREMKGEDPQSLPTPNSPASSPAPQLHFNAKHSPSHLPTSDHAANDMAHGADGPEIDVSVHSCNTTHSGKIHAGESSTVPDNMANAPVPEAHAEVPPDSHQEALAATFAATNENGTRSHSSFPDGNTAYARAEIDVKSPSSSDSKEPFESRDRDPLRDFRPAPFAATNENGTRGHSSFPDGNTAYARAEIDLTSISPSSSDSKEPFESRGRNPLKHFVLASVSSKAQSPKPHLQLGIHSANQDGGSRMSGGPSGSLWS